MVTVLKMKFLDSKGKPQYLKIAYPKPKLDAKTVQNAMEEIVATNLFYKGDVQLYAEPVAAYYISTTKEPVFTDGEYKRNVVELNPAPQA